VDIKFPKGQTARVRIKAASFNATSSATLIVAPERGSYSETRWFSTKIFTSVKRIETRKPMLRRYQHKVSYDVAIAGAAKIAMVQNSLLYNKYMVCYQPLWGEAFLISNNNVAGNIVYTDTTIIPSLRYDSVLYSDNVYMGLWDVNDNFRGIVRVLDWTDSTVILDKNLDPQYYSYMMPVVLMKINKTSSIKKKNSNFATFSISAEEVRVERVIYG